jgi:hypothetical protein
MMTKAARKDSPELQEAWGLLPPVTLGDHLKTGHS